MQSGAGSGEAREAAVNSAQQNGGSHLRPAQEPGKATDPTQGLVLAKFSCQGLDNIGRKRHAGVTYEA